MADIGTEMTLRSRGDEEKILLESRKKMGRKADNKITPGTSTFTLQEDDDWCLTELNKYSD